MKSKEKRCFKKFADAWYFLNTHDMFTVEIDDEKISKFMKCINIDVLNFDLYGAYEEIKKKYNERDYAVTITYSPYIKVLENHKIIGNKIEGPDFESCIIKLANVIFKTYGHGNSDSNRIIEYYEDSISDYVRLS